MNIDKLPTTTVLLHICCGVCAAWPVQKLREDGHTVVGYFYNPNIHPEEEYQKRMEAARKAADALELDLIEGLYDPDSWFAAVSGFEDEAEGGKRCDICFRMRLEETKRKAKELGIPSVATTLTVSPHKDAKKINKIGKITDPAGYLEYDFKKTDGFSVSKRFSKSHDLYCQKYCGCKFSARL